MRFHGAPSSEPVRGGGRAAAGDSGGTAWEIYCWPAAEDLGVPLPLIIVK